MLIPRPLTQSLARVVARHGLVRERQQPRVPRYIQGHARWVSQQGRGQPQQHIPAEPAEDANKVQDDRVEGLPAPGEGIKLDVSGEGSSVSLGHLGPLVVNRDGTTGRVTNWETMTAHEKGTTMALLKKRNKARLDALKSKDEPKS